MILFRCQLLCTKRILEGGERKEKFSGSLLESWQRVYKKHIFLFHTPNSGMYFQSSAYRYIDYMSYGIIVSYEINAEILLSTEEYMCPTRTHNIELLQCPVVRCMQQQASTHFCSSCHFFSSSSSRTFSILIRCCSIHAHTTHHFSFLIISLANGREREKKKNL